MRDFFISYNKADKHWAEWVAWILEEAGYTTYIQAWDFRPGTNFVLEMQRASSDAERTIAILSQDYIDSAYTQSEWAAAFVSDPRGQYSKLIPIRVAKCELKGLLSSIVYIDIVGLSREEARNTILSGLINNRAAPKASPIFPPEANQKKTRKARYPGINRIKLFCSYSRRDEEFLHAIEKHLSPLRRQALVEVWFDGKITPGQEWEPQIEDNIRNSDIILILISADYLASEWCHREIELAMQMYEEKRTVVIPIILRPAAWQSTPLAKFQVLPRDGKPVSEWHSTDAAFVNIVDSIRMVCEELIDFESDTEPIIETDTQSSEPDKIFDITEVFKPTGVPSVTFVERNDFYLIKLALRQPGLGVVIEGPSGIGKTTTLKKAIEQFEQNFEVRTLSARRIIDISEIENIERLHNGIIAIDDFHRLSNSTKSMLVDYLKYLADNEVNCKKLIIVGIPGTGKRLVDLSYDVGTRIRTFKIDKVSDELILQMISKGEEALNIVFDRKAEIVRAAGGSLNIAQILCANILARDGVQCTQKKITHIRCEIENAVMEVLDVLAPKYSDVIRFFLSLGGVEEKICARLLEELAMSENGFLPLQHLKAERPELSKGIDRFISEDFMKILKIRCPNCDNFIFYDDLTHSLAIDDPQFAFYLRQIPLAKIIL